MVKYFITHKYRKMKKVKIIAAALSLIVLFTGTIKAGTINNGFPHSVGEPANEALSVKFLGEDSKYLFFEVAIRAGGNKTVSFAVSDKTEGELYAVVLKSDKVQTYKIEKREGQELDFNLYAGNTNITKTYSTVEKLNAHF
jgi:hypothetical protein